MPAPGSGSSSRRRGSVAAAIAGTRRYIRNETQGGSGSAVAGGRGGGHPGHGIVATATGASPAVDSRRRSSRAAVAGLAHATMSPLNHAPAPHIGGGGDVRRPRSRAIHGGDPAFKLGHLGLGPAADGLGSSPLRPGLDDGPMGTSPGLGNFAKGLLRSSLAAPVRTNADPAVQGGGGGGRGAGVIVSPLKMQHTGDSSGGVGPGGLELGGAAPEARGMAPVGHGEGGRPRVVVNSGGGPRSTSPVVVADGDHPGAGDGLVVKSRLPPLQGMLAPVTSNTVAKPEPVVAATTPGSHAPMSPLTSAVASRRGSGTSPTLATMLSRSPAPSPVHDSRHRATAPLGASAGSDNLPRQSSPLATTSTLQSSPLASESDMIAAAFGGAPARVNSMHSDQRQRR